METQEERSGSREDASFREEALSDRTFQRFFEALPGSFLVLTPDMTIVAVSEAFLLGARTRREDLLGRNLFEVFRDDPDDPEAVTMKNLRASLTRVLTNKAADSMAVQRFGFRRPASEGGGFEERYWSPINSPVLDEAGEVSFLIHRVEDVTEYVRSRESAHRMEAELFHRAQELQRTNEQLERRTRQLELLTRQLQESENKFRRIFESNMIGIVFGDIQGGLYDVNEYYARLIGIPREKILAGQVRWDVLTPPEDLEKDRAAAKEMLESPAGVCSPYEKRYILEGGRVVWVLLGVAFLDEHRFKNVGFVLDITHSKEAEEQLASILNREQQEREAVELALNQLQLERELRERFVSSLSHDLRTPLTAAKMSAQLIPRQANLPDKVYSLAAKVKHNIDRADQMITDLLDANRIRAGQGLPVEPAPCELRQVVVDALEDLATVHGERFDLRGDERIPGNWDAGALRRLTENLCNNAIKYGDPTGRVTVSVRQDGDEAELTVHNWGNPIPAEEQESLFQYFGRTKSAEASGKRGWGIGLTLVKGVAEAHGGSVRVESTQEKGTTFTVRLPRNANPVALR